MLTTFKMLPKAKHTLEPKCFAVFDRQSMAHKSEFKTYRPLAGYGLPPPRGNFVDHIFHKAQCLARILQHVSPLTMVALGCNSLLHTLPYKIFDN